MLRGQPCVSFVYRHRTRDITKNEPIETARGTVDALLGTRFAHAHLLTPSAELQLMMSRKGRYTLHRTRGRERRGTQVAVDATRRGGCDAAHRDETEGVDAGVEPATPRACRRTTASKHRLA